MNISQKVYEEKSYKFAERGRPGFFSNDDIQPRQPGLNFRPGSYHQPGDNLGPLGDGVHEPGVAKVSRKGCS